MIFVKYCPLMVILIVLTILPSLLTADVDDDYDFQVFEEEMAAARARARARLTPTTSTTASVSEKPLYDDSDVYDNSYQGKTYFCF